MEYTKVGFIGAGNMGRALIQSLLSFNKLSKPIGGMKIKNSDKVVFHKKFEKIMIFDPNPQAKKHLPKSEVSWCHSPEEVIRGSSFIFLCIKPKDVKTFFSVNKKYFQKQIVISIIAGFRISSLRKAAHVPQLKVCRIMPNLAALIGQGTGTVTYSRNISRIEKSNLERILSASGLYIETQETLVDAVTAVSGCGPAFVFLFIEALTQAAIKLKIPRKQALRFATNTIIGAGSLLQESGQEPLELTTQVTSPGGMTIEGVNRLNNSDFKNIVMDAVFRTHDKAKELFIKT